MFNFLRHIFIPHESNGHRPKILHHESLAIFIVVLLGLVHILPPLQREYPSVLGISYNIDVDDLVRLTNERRSEAGLKPLTLNPELSSAAQSKATYMFEKNFWAHVAPDGTTPWYFIKNAGYEYQYAGENLARGFNTAEDVTNAWMASPTHRENLLSPNYNEIGFAIASGTLTGSETVLVVQEFGSKYTATGEVAAVSQPAVAIPTPAVSTAQVREDRVSEQKSQTVVAASVNKPLIDTKSGTNNMSVIILGLFIVVLVFEMIFIERKRISKIVVHNLDHIIFLVVLLTAVIIVGSGAIL